MTLVFLFFVLNYTNWLKVEDTGASLMDVYDAIIFAFKVFTI